MFRGYKERERGCRDSLGCRDSWGGDPPCESRQPNFKTKRREIGTFIQSQDAQRLKLIDSFTISFVDLKSNSALLYNKGHNKIKSLLTRYISPNLICPLKKINFYFKLNV